MTEAKHPEIEDVDLTHKLLEIAEKTAGDRTMAATHRAAYTQLGTINAALQEKVDKQNEEAAKKQAAAEAKAAEEAKAAQRKAEDEADAAAKKAAEDAEKKKAEQDAAVVNPAAEPEHVKMKRKELEEKTKDELVAIADDLDIEVSHSWAKSDIVDAILKGQ